MWSINWQRRGKLILSTYINRLLHRVWYLNCRCPVVHRKLLAKYLNSRPRILIFGRESEFQSSYQILNLKPSAEYHFLVKISFQLFTFNDHHRIHNTINTLDRSCFIKLSQYHRWSQLLIKKIRNCEPKAIKTMIWLAEFFKRNIIK